MSLKRLPHACDQMRAHVEDEGVPIAYSPRFREYGIRLIGHVAVQLIDYCPWCGVALPAPLRDEYFDALEAQAIDVDILTELDEIPAEYRDDAWWWGRESH